METMKLLIIENINEIIEDFKKYLDENNEIDHLIIDDLTAVASQGAAFAPDIVIASYDLGGDELFKIAQMTTSYFPYIHFVISLSHEKDIPKIEDIVKQCGYSIILKPFSKHELIFNILSKGKLTKQLKNVSAQIIELQRCMKENQVNAAQNTSFDLNVENKISVNMNETTELFKLFAEKCSDVFWIIDPLTGTFQYVSPNVEDLRGYTPEEVMKQQPHEWLTPESIQHMMISWQEEFEIIKRGDPDPRRWKTIELEQLCKDGSTIWTEAIGTKLIDDNGNIYAFMGVTRNIEQRKKIENELMNNNEELARIVEERTQKLKEAQRMEAVGLIAGSVAHDLNNILGSIIGYPDFIMSMIDEQSRAMKYLRTIKDSGLRAADIVADMLSFANINIMNRKVENLNDIISSYLKSPEYNKLREKYPTLNISVNLHPTLKNFIVNSTSIMKVIMNLCNNAADAILENGNIELITENVIIDGAHTLSEDLEPGEYIHLKVTDNGQGIERKDLKNIFKPFYTKKKLGRKGTGLGMTIIKNTIEDYNGYVHVESDVSVGTTFHIYIPSTDKTIEKAQVFVTFDHVSGNEQILVLDDYEEQREMISVILSNLGYHVTTVATGEDALEYLKDNNADVFITDMVLENDCPGTDIYLKVKEFKPEQKAIIISGYSKPETIQNALSLGIKAFVKKPYTIEELGKAIRNVLETE